jgi:hypothetical protein
LDTLAALQKALGPRLRFAHEPRPGVATARNAALQLASGDMIAWLDDDQEAPPTWIAETLRVQNLFTADVVFSPVTARAPEPRTAIARHVEQLYTRAGPSSDCVLSAPFGVGASLMRRAALGDAPFDAAADETGGEDDRLFARFAAEGRSFAWAAHPAVTEYIDPARVTVSYALRRAFAYGQGPCETAAAQAPPQVATLARHMAVGALQAPVFGMAAAGAFAVGHPHRYALLDRAARGFGKVFWWRPQRFYGAATLSAGEALDRGDHGVGMGEHDAHQGRARRSQRVA